MKELRKYGESPGPIVDSTRGLYQNKLARLMAQNTKASNEGRSRPSESVDYRTDHLEEWSSQSSEGETEETEKDEDYLLKKPKPSPSKTLVEPSNLHRKVQGQWDGQRNHTHLPLTELPRRKRTREHPI